MTLVAKADAASGRHRLATSKTTGPTTMLLGSSPAVQPQRSESASPRIDRLLFQQSERRQRLRARYSAAVVTQIEQLLLTNLHAVAPSSLLGKALHHLHGQWPKLVRFLDNGTWPLDTTW